MSESKLTKEQVDAWLAEQAALEQAEDEKIYQDLVAWLAERNREIVCIVQIVNGGMAAVPAWGVQRKRGTDDSQGL